MLNITYKGRNKEQLENPLQKAIVERTENYFEEKLEPLSEEIEATGAEITIDIPQDLTHLSVSTSHITEELKEKVKDELMDEGQQFHFRF